MIPDSRSEKQPLTERDSKQPEIEKKSIATFTFADRLWKIVQVTVGILAPLAILAAFGMSILAILLSLALEKERVASPKHLVGNEWLLVILGIFSGIFTGSGAITTGIALQFKAARTWEAAWYLVGLGTGLGFLAGTILGFGPTPPNNGCYSGFEALGQKLIGFLAMSASVICLIILGGCLLVFRPIRQACCPPKMPTSDPQPTIGS